jgi:hypothetical protein
MIAALLAFLPANSGARTRNQAGFPDLRQLCDCFADLEQLALEL